jgi:hypothetical protein
MYLNKKLKKMNLTEIYIREVFLKNFLTELEGMFPIDESLDPGLTQLLNKANTIIFDKFGINPSDQGKYFIAGSARLYLSTPLRDVFGLKGTLGDLDIVIPDEELWRKAGLEKELASGGIYRPTKDGSIEVFTKWDPAKAGGEYANTKVRSTDEILGDAELHNGYYFMKQEDVMDYKMKLSREKDEEVVDLARNFIQGGKKDRNGFIRKFIEIVGKDNARRFLGGGSPKGE